MGRAFAVLGLVVLAACSSSTEKSAPKMETLSGTLDALGDCIAAGNGYEIVVKDEAGKIIATTTTATFPTNPNSTANVCDAIRFSVEVPNREFYTLEIGQHKAPTWSRSDLVAAIGPLISSSM